MKFDPKILESIDSVIKKSNRILIIPHKSPDGDAIGSALALYQLFLDLGKSPSVVCYDEVPPVFNFLPNVERVQKGLEKIEADTIFIVDSGATHLTGLTETHPQLFDKTLEVVNIDHHPSNDFYGKYNLVVSQAASTTEVLYHLFTALDFSINRSVATCLLTGLYTDTGSFMHSNTNSAVLRTAGKLLSKGADIRMISKEIFNTTKISTMRLWGRVMKNAYQTPDKVTMSVVTKKDFEDTGADYSEMTGVVDYINAVPGSKYSVILTERDGKVKGSLRTLREEVDVAEIAGQYGGGGHVKAAGFTLPGHLEQEIKWKVVSQ